jgi:hypothetical protein
VDVSRAIPIALATVSLATAVAPAALAGGEPKNDSPFTRPALGHASTQVSRLAGGTGVRVPVGEPKNEAPFTQPVPSVTSIVVRSGGGFDWTDALLGAAAGIGAAVAAIGGVTLSRASRGRAPRPVVYESSAKR